MPVHSFLHEESQETIDVYVPANAPTIEHSQQTRDGKVYKRVYSAPLAATNLGTRLGDATQQDFNRITTDKKGFRVGDAWEVAQEMSEKRKQRDGVDVVRERAYEKYEKENGEKHPDVVKREKAAEANRRLEEMGIKIKL